jgi:hypothetical protein
MSAVLGVNEDGGFKVSEQVFRFCSAAVKVGRMSSLTGVELNSITLECSCESWLDAKFDRWRD